MYNILGVKMSIQRRDILKFPILAMSATILDAQTKIVQKQEQKPKIKVVVIGGGFGGLTFAKKFKLLQKDIDVTIIDKNELFMTGPMYNLMLGEVKDVSFDTITHKREIPAKKYGYNLLYAEVFDIDRVSKEVHTTKGIVSYDYLILSPGIAYDYEKQFPNWDKEKILRAKMEAPAALIPGGEFFTLLDKLKNFKGGNIVLSVPLGEYRCPPAPYERACMFAQYIRNHKLDAKVIVIDNYSRPVSKTEAFEEAFRDVYPDIIEYHGDCTLEDVDFDKKVVKYSFWGEGSGDDGDMKEVSFDLLNIMVKNKASEVIKMAKIKTLGWGSAKLKAPTYQSISDENIYVIGDCVGYGFPESGQMANSMAAICAKHLSQRIDGKKVTQDMPGNICISMINTNPNEAISDSHNISYDGKKFKVVRYMPYDEVTKKYRSAYISQTLFAWYEGIMNDMMG
jgi:NADPH-dependent 2,4-dienoyl-CoA reductase/sulfur reductase-like enzyme